MSATYSPASGADRDRVRLLIPDKTITGLTAVDGVYTLTTYLFSDEEADGLLVTEASAPRAAALALYTVAGSEAMLKKVSGLGFMIEPTASAIRAYADSLFALADADDAATGAATGALFDVAEQVPNEFAARERLWNERLRGLV